MSAVKKVPDPSGILLNNFDDVVLSQATYEKFAHYMYEIAGVNLPFNPKNYALIRNRIIKILRRQGLRDYDQYWKYLRQGDKKVVNEFVSALTTNMTSFYRESSHFNFLRLKLPEFFAKNSEVRIWCAAASTGQEPYTLAMTVCDALTPQQVAHTKILATDIDLEV